MIGDSEVETRIREIDAALAADSGPLRLGIGLFTALMRKGLISDHPPAPHDAEPIDGEPTSYRGERAVVNDPELADDEFRVG